MDTPATSTPVLLHTHTSKQQTLKRVAFIAIILSALVTIVAYGVPYLSHTGAPGTSTAFAVSIGPTPASPLRTLDRSTNTLVSLTVSVNGKALPALDVIKTTDGSRYYILAEAPPTPIANLYQKKPDGSIVKLTNSSTMKYNLSYDAASGKFAYQSLTYTAGQDSTTNKSWNLVVFDPVQHAEIVVGKGMNPHLVSGGASLIFMRGNEIDVALLGSQATSTLVALAPGSVYAINPEATELSLYNPVTHKIDHFKITHGTSLSYVSSDGTPLNPSVLGYMGGHVVAGYFGRQGNETYLSFSRPDLNGADKLTIQGPAGIQAALPQRIYAYE